MVLPLYVSLEKIDRRLIEAARTCTRGRDARRHARRRHPGWPARLVVGIGWRYVRAAWAGASPCSTSSSSPPSARSSGRPSRSLLVTRSRSCSITFPLSLSGHLRRARSSCSSPPIGDYVNAELLGQPEDADDRQRHPEPLPAPERLSDRCGAVVHADGRHPDRHRHLRPGASAPTSSPGRDGIGPAATASAVQPTANGVGHTRRAATGRRPHGCCPCSRVHRASSTC